MTRDNSNTELQTIMQINSQLKCQDFSGECELRRPRCVSNFPTNTQRNVKHVTSNYQKSAQLYLFVPDQNGTTTLLHESKLDSPKKRGFCDLEMEELEFVAMCKDKWVGLMVKMNFILSAKVGYRFVPH